MVQMNNMHQFKSMCHRFTKVNLSFELVCTIHALELSYELECNSLLISVGMFNYAGAEGIFRVRMGKAAEPKPKSFHQAASKCVDSSKGS